MCLLDSHHYAGGFAVLCWLLHGAADCTALYCITAIIWMRRAFANECFLRLLLARYVALTAHLHLDERFLAIASCLQLARWLGVADPQDGNALRGFCKGVFQRDSRTETC